MQDAQDVGEDGSFTRHKARLAARVAASLLGGYVFVWGLVALGTVATVAAGMPYSQAQTLMYLLAFLVFVAAFCWSFSERGLLRIWAALGGGGAAMTLLAWLCSRALP